MKKIELKFHCEQLYSTYRNMSSGNMLVANDFIQTMHSRFSQINDQTILLFIRINTQRK